MRDWDDLHFVKYGNEKNPHSDIQSSAMFPRVTFMSRDNEQFGVHPERIAKPDIKVIFQ